ncbi:MULTISPECIES: phage recombination protein Bet [Streptomyces]|uniref:phage recombination protein Bet n=1 Tax=Streptomyces TaxID=1883 RepID=UPI00067B805D|nr:MULTISPECIES: phage recombination protein Bet [Streptomyces]
MTTTDITQAGGSLAIRADQTGWTDDQAAVLRQSGIDNQVAAAELSAFLHLCQRTRLDPFSRQIYLIGRWNGQQQRKVYTPQTSIDGYRVIAHRAAADAGHALGYDDTLWCAKDGRWRDVWLDEDPPAAAKVTVIRNGMRFAAVARYAEYVQTKKGGEPSGLWVKMPATMTAKCAEALALRMAFPHDLAGVYTAEEMAQADNPSAEERHLRKVEPRQGDPWATPAPGRDFLTEAETAPDVEAVRQIWREAKQAGMPDPVLAGIVEISKLKDAAAAEPTAAPETGSEGVVEAEVVSPEDDYADAVAQLRAAAEAAHLEDFDNGVAGALGMPLADAPVEAIRALTAQIRPAA